MTERFTSSEWDVLPADGAGGAHGPARGRAAIWLWVIGGLEVVLFSCLATAFAVFGAMAWSEIETTFAAQDMPGDVVEMYRSIHPHAGKLALGLSLIGVLPGLAYLVLGFLVRAGGARAALVASVLLLTQAVVVGLYGALSVFGALTTGQPGMVTMMVLMYGTSAALLVMALRSVNAARIAPAQAADGGDSSGWIA